MKALIALIPFFLFLLGCENSEEEIQDLDQMVQVEEDLASELADHSQNALPQESTQEILMREPFESPDAQN